MYDRNPVFGIIALGDYPLTEMLVTVGFNNREEPSSLDSLYTVNIDIGVK